MNTKHTPLIVAIALPVVFVIVLALVVLIPNMSIKPQHDFIYISPNSPGYANDFGTVQYRNTYDLKEDKIVLKPLTLVPTPDKSFPVPVYENAPTIYYYDIEDQASREISLEEAQKLSLQKGPASPDGYTVSYDMNHEGVFEIFGSQDKSAYIISKGNGKKPLMGIVGSDMYYQAELNIIGWIK